MRDFKNVVVPTDVIERIIATGLKAPTNDHMRDWHYVVIQDKNVVMQLLDIYSEGNLRRGYESSDYRLEFK